MHRLRGRSAELGRWIYRYFRLLCLPPKLSLFSTACRFSFFSQRRLVQLCAALPAVDGATIAYGDDQRTVDSVATYSCTAADLVLGGGNEMRACQADGSWGGAAPTSCIVRRSPPRTQKCLGICVPDRFFGGFWSLVFVMEKLR